MIRILIFLLGIVFIAGAITVLSSLDSRITGEAFGQRFDGPSGIILGAAFMVLLFAIYLTHKIKDIMALPAKLRVRDAQTHQSRGIAALTRGLEAVAVGDADDATHHARVARRHLHDIALTRLLTAQAAQLSGDHAEAGKSFSAMLEAPETEFLGLRGLYAQAMAAEETQKARQYAERAFRLRPNADWAFQSVFELGLERGAWGETRAALASARKNKLISGEKADRANAALLTADAYASSQGGDTKTALHDLDAALKVAPGLTPASILAAILYADAGKRGKSAKILEAAFGLVAHPAIIKAYDRLYKDETTEKRAKRLRALADLNVGAPEAALLQARAATLAEDWPAAIETLEPLLSAGPNAAAFSLMAKAIAGRDGEEAGRVWLEHAAAAPRDPRPGADGAFQLTRDGWARLIREYTQSGQLGPPPIEEASSGLSIEEVRLLIAPPTPPAPVETPDAVAEQIEDVAEIENQPKDELGDLDEEAPGEDTSTVPASHDDGDHIHNDEDAERAAAAARNVS